MACFLVPMTEAIGINVAEKVVKRERAEGWKQRWKLGWLNKMLWGGVALLAVEHVWHGEVVPWPPFLTAMENPADVGPMLHEMGTHGLPMAVLVTVVWVIMVAIARSREKAPLEEKPLPKEAV